MCQLLGMNASSPTSFSFCFRGFCGRGGGHEGDRNVDGWGLAFAEAPNGRAYRTFLDTEACAHSPMSKFAREYPARTQNMLAHIRCATHGRRGLENTHPFQREMWGIPVCFAHNGEVAAFCDTGRHVLLGKAVEGEELIYHAMGGTDSEALFCAILNSIRAEFRKPPSLPALYTCLYRLMDELSKQNETIINNFLLAIGPDLLFCYSWPGCQPGSDVWNGLSYAIIQPSGRSDSSSIEDSDYSIDFNPCRHLFDESDPSSSRKDCKIAAITTKPRTLSPCTDAQKWVEMKRGELLLFCNGVPYKATSDLERLELSGHGLSSRCFPNDTHWLASRSLPGELVI